jgi:hypothetical protein
MKGGSLSTAVNQYGGLACKAFLLGDKRRNNDGGKGVLTVTVEVRAIWRRIVPRSWARAVCRAGADCTQNTIQAQVRKARNVSESQGPKPRQHTERFEQATAQAYTTHQAFTEGNGRSPDNIPNMLMHYGDATQTCDRHLQPRMYRSHTIYVTLHCNIKTSQNDLHDLHVR